MDIFYKVIALLGGLSMFLYGMRMMGDALKSSSSGKMREFLGRVTDKPVMAFIFGMLVTCMIQSSTATIVLTVGLVGAGLMTFRQSIGIVFGANVGTAITAQVIRLMDVQAGATSILYFFKADNLAPIALIIGIVCIMFIKSDKSKSIGNVAIGFGILFMGLIFMSNAVGDMREGLSGMLTAFEGNYILGFGSGVLVTGIIQSSSAVIGILQSMASSVGVKFCGVFAIIIGVNIGDCLTTFLVSRIGAKPEQIKTAMVHVEYNICAAILITITLTILRSTGILTDDIWNMTLNSGGVANVHGLFRLVPAVCLLPFSGLFAKLTDKLIKEEPTDDEDAAIEAALRLLDKRFIANPAVALEQVEAVIFHMSEVAVHNYQACVDQIFKYEEARNGRLNAREEQLDRMMDAASEYLLAVMPNITLEKNMRTFNFLSKALTIVERIGDLAVNIADDTLRLKKYDRAYSKAALKEIKVITLAVGDILTKTQTAFVNEDEVMTRDVEPIEEVIDDLIQELKDRHIVRMAQNVCDSYASIQYEDMLSNLERISDKCSDLAVFMLGIMDPAIAGAEHEYLHILHHSDNARYQDMYTRTRSKYFDLLKEMTELEIFSETSEDEVADALKLIPTEA